MEHECLASFGTHQLQKVHLHSADRVGDLGRGGEGRGGGGGGEGKGREGREGREEKREEGEGRGGEEEAKNIHLAMV